MLTGKVRGKNGAGLFIEGGKAMTYQDDEEEEIIRTPDEVIPPVEVEEEPDELADLFEVPQSEDNDMATDHLVDIDEEEDLSDLTTVTNEDIMGSPPIVRKRKASPRKVALRHPPPTTLGGVGY